MVCGGNFATPWRALAVLDAAIPEYRLYTLNAQPGIPDRPGVTLETSFTGPGVRGREQLRYYPGRLSLVPRLLAETLPPDVVLLHTSAPAGGTVSLGVEVNVLPAAVETVRARGGLVVAQLNPRMPYTFGDAVLPCGEIDYAIEVDDNPRIRMLRTEKTNDPSVIARQPQMISVNTALQVDLFAQANASRLHGMIYSGFGGQTNFVVGALHSAGGHAIIALPSWHPKADVSTVVPQLTGPVTSFQHSFIISEQGTAAIWGHHSSAQAQQIIDHVAHPAVRSELLAIGQHLGLRLS